MKTVWIVSEGSPGHMSQSTGLAEALSTIIPLQTVTVQGREKIRGWLRPFVRRMMGPEGRSLSEKVIRRVVDINIPNGSPAPDVILSSGGKSVFAARTLAQRYNVPYVFIGERKPFPAKWFHTVVSPVPGESSANSIDVELIPTPVSPQMISAKGAVDPGTWCMIIGGTSRSHRFREKDWICLADGMNSLAKRKNIRWLITTSRRTGSAVESILRRHISPAVVRDVVWWAEHPRKELYTFMARSEVLFVTQDSVTMVTEAVSSGKPVIAVYPEKVAIPENSFMNSYFNQLQKKRRIARVNVSTLMSFEVDPKSFFPIDGSVIVEAAELLHRRLAWESEGR